MSKITYADKVALNTNTEIPSQNKVEDTDMNNIKGAVNEIGKYNTATAGTNGDFYVTLKGTLSSGDIVHISFPTATVPSANARLSIDGGVTYKNIFNGVQVIASAVASKLVRVYYDGTQWQIDNRKSSITLQLNTDQVQNSFTGGVNVSMSLLNQIGNKLTFDSSSGGVKIGIGVTKVAVQQSMLSEHTTATNTNSYVMKNSSPVAGSSNRTAANARLQSVIPKKIIDTEANDIFVARIYVANSGNLTINAGEGMTYLTIEEIE